MGNLFLKRKEPIFIEAAFALGMAKKQVFFKGQLPLAVRAIVASIRLCATSTIGFAFITTTINAGGFLA